MSCCGISDIIRFPILNIGRLKRMEKEKVLENNLRLFWTQPALAAQLSEGQRKKVTEKFFEILKKSEKKD